MDEDGNQGYYLYNEATVEEKLFSVVEEEERLYFLGEHKGKFGKGGTASGVVFTGKDILKEGQQSRLMFGPKGTNGGKALDYSNLVNSKKLDNAVKSANRFMHRQGVTGSQAVNYIQNKATSVVDPNLPKRVDNKLKTQKFNKSTFGKFVNKFKK